MQYPYLTFLEITTFILALIFGVIIFYYLIKLFFRADKPLKILESILLYEIIAYLIYVIYPFPFLAKIWLINIIKVLDLLIFISIIFVAFGLAMRWILKINFKKFLLLFIIITFLLFPLIDYIRNFLTVEIQNLSLFNEENMQIQQQINNYGIGQFIIFGPQTIDPYLEMVGKIEGGMLFSGLNSYIRNTIISLTL